MTQYFEELENIISSLNNDEWIQKFRNLLAYIDGTKDTDVDEEWLQEVERRFLEIKEGRVQPIPADDVFAQAKTRLKNKVHPVKMYLAS